MAPRHRSQDPAYLILGSTIASRISDTSVPMTASAALSITKAPASCMSCARSASRKIGPAVGSPNTTAVMTVPEIREGSTHPTVERNGLIAMRNGYLKITRILLSEEVENDDGRRDQRHW